MSSQDDLSRLYMEAVGQHYTCIKYTHHVHVQSYQVTKAQNLSKMGWYKNLILHDVTAHFLLFGTLVTTQ